MTAAAARPPFFPDVDAFLAWEATQQARWELFDGAPKMMVGARRAHHRVLNNVASALEAQSVGRGCDVFRESFKLKLGRAVLYPDVMLVCPSPPDDALWTEDAQLVVEVLSPSNSFSEMQRKLLRYQQAPSLAAYLVLEQDRAEGWLFRRAAGAWAAEELAGLEAVASIPELDLTLTAAKIWRDVDLVTPIPQIGVVEEWGESTP